MELFCWWKTQNIDRTEERTKTTLYNVPVQGDTWEKVENCIQNKIHDKIYFNFNNNYGNLKI